MKQLQRIGTIITQNSILLICILAFFAIRLLWLKTTISRDEGAFGLVAMMWKRGTLPTYWLDIQGPLIHVIYAFVTLLFGNSIIPVRLLNNLLFIGSCLVIYWISSGWFGKRIGLLSVLCYGISMNIAILEAMTALTEPISIPFAGLSLFLCIRYTQHNHWPNLIASGLLMSAATLIRATNGVGFLLLLMVLIRNTHTRARAKQLSIRSAITLLILGALIPVLTFLSYFGMKGDLYGLMKLYFRATSQFASFQDVPLYIKYLILLENLPVWIFSVVGTLVAIRIRTDNHKFLLLWAFLFVSVSLIPPSFGHRMILHLPAVCILAGLGLDYAPNWIENTFHHNHTSLEKRKFKIGYVIAVLLLVTLFIPSIFYQSKQYPQLNLSYNGMQWAYADADYTTQIAVSKYLLSNTSPEGSVFVHAWAAEIYWLAEKAPPTKHVWSLGLLPEDEQIRLSNLTKNTTFEYMALFSPSYGDLFARAESYDPIVKYFFDYYFLDINIENAYIFSKYDNSNSRVVYSFIDKFEESSKYYDLGNGTFGKAQEITRDVFEPQIWIVRINSDIRYAIQQTPQDQTQDGDVVKSYISYNVHIPPTAILKFAIAIDPNFWDKAHDTRFEIHIRNDTNTHVIFDEIIDPKNEPSSQWKDQTVSLYKFANQDVKVIFVISTGPSMNNAYSFAVWGNPVMVAN